MPLEELEEHIKQRQVERLQDEIEEALATIQSVNVDRQTIEDYKELKSETDTWQVVGLTDVVWENIMFSLSFNLPI